MTKTILAAGLFVLFASNIATAYAETETDPAPSGVERNEINIDHDTGVIIGGPGRDAGEQHGNTIDFTKGTDAGTDKPMHDWDPDTTTINHESN